eukprot:6201997-Pleurochrysis_carterae.AAC.1
MMRAGKRSAGIEAKPIRSSADKATAAVVHENFAVGHFKALVADVVRHHHEASYILSLGQFRRYSVLKHVSYVNPVSPALLLRLGIACTMDQYCMSKDQSSFVRKACECISHMDIGYGVNATGG